MAERGAAVVLAAGAGQRLGGVAKALLPIDGVSYLARIVATAGEVGVDAADVVVVAGPPFVDEVAAAAEALGARVVVNATPERGMASSVALGFAALPAAARWALLWPVDHPAVAAATVRTLLGALTPAAAGVVPTCAGRGGHPVVVAPSLWSALAAGADVVGGARELLRQAPMVRLAVDDPAVVRDVDTPADRAALGRA